MAEEDHVPRTDLDRELTCHGVLSQLELYPGMVEPATFFQIEYEETMV